ncbi:MAG: hypothetical protein WAN71_05210 [Mycobacterium sp.]|uniref:hypothetical protein n=1 Tax=Mycobacterium sp. TaxID=1785 RepID=UPI003BB07286
MSIRSHDGPTNDQRRRRVAPAAGFGVVAAGAIGAALLSAAIAPAAQADPVSGAVNVIPDLDPFEDLFPSNPDAAILDGDLLTYAVNPTFWAGLFDGFVDDFSTIPNVGPLNPPGAEPDPFEDIAGTNSGVALQLDTVFTNYQPALAVLLDKAFDALPPPDNDALADLTQAFGATGGAYIAELEQLITGVPVTDSLADMVIASMGLGPF